MSGARLRSRFRVAASATITGSTRTGRCSHLRAHHTLDAGMTTERTESEGFYEMLWDCDHCGQK